MDEEALHAEAMTVREKAEAMLATDLDKWYEEHVGYSLVEENPRISPTCLTAQVAGMMFFHAMPEGVDTKGAEAMEKRLTASILNGGKL